MTAPTGAQSPANQPTRCWITRVLAAAITEFAQLAGPRRSAIMAVESLRGNLHRLCRTDRHRGPEQTSASTYDFHLEAIAASLADVPLVGLLVLYEVARQRHPADFLPYKEFCLNAVLLCSQCRCPNRITGVLTPIILDHLIPEFKSVGIVKIFGDNRHPLAETQSERPGANRDAITGLSSLFNQLFAVNVNDVSSAGTDVLAVVHTDSVAIPRF